MDGFVLNTKPILKWVGGKSKLVQKIIPYFPRDYRNRVFHEPFMGGGAMFYEVRPKNGSINDINQNLMTFYRVVRDHPNELINEISNYEYSRECFYINRNRYNNDSKLSDIEKSAIFLYLNKTCYNGMYRVNSKGRFNSAFGRFSDPLRTPIIVSEERIKYLNSLLQGIDIFNLDFSYIKNYIKKNDLVYFDPPYQPISNTENFTSYSISGFTINEQIKLRDICLNLDKQNVIFIQSNSYEKNIISLYKDTNFKIYEIQVYRSVGSQNESRKRVKEIIITNNINI
jgi:DNA adenine methylase